MVVISELDLKNFAKKYDLLNTFISRIILLWNFKDLISKNLINKKAVDVAIVGGSLDEIELMFVENKSTVRLFGIENYQTWLDLNITSENKQKFDLVICNQVFEHIWHINNAFLTLKNMLKERGLLWISCPHSNMAHGSPSFYSTGYTNSFLDNHATLIGLQKIKSSSFGSKRIYHYQHVMHCWPTAREYFNPVSYFVFNHKNYFKAKMLTRIFLAISDSKFTNDELTNTETFGLYRNGI